MLDDLPVRPVVPPARQLVDPFGRRIDYLRVSITDRCDFRCTYCMAEQMTFLPRAEVLGLDEIDRLASAFVRRGTRKLRLTGGEPLVRGGVDDLVRSLSRHLATGALEELTLTTNGARLAKHAEALAAAGVRRVNVSLDTLDAARFRRITRWGDLGRVLDGIAAATAAGLKVRLNTVALKGVNDDEFDDLLAFASDHGHDLVLIETMPMGEVAEDRVDRYLPLGPVRRALAGRWPLTDVTDTTGGPARYMRLAGTRTRLGFITPLSHEFCGSCNRVRLTATGQLFLCLGQDAAADLRAVVRGHDGDGALDAAIDAAIRLKPRSHDFRIEARAAAPAVARHMSVTGG